MMFNLSKFRNKLQQREKKTLQGAKENTRLALRGGARSGSHGSSRKPNLTPTKVTRSAANKATHNRGDAIWFLSNFFGRNKE